MLILLFALMQAPSAESVPPEAAAPTQSAPVPADDGPVATRAPETGSAPTTPAPLLLNRAPDTVPSGPAAPAGQLFISPMGEPFRAVGEAVYPVGEWFSRADTDKDGALSSDEFVLDARAFFAVLDANKDGEIDGFEDTDYESKIAPELAAGGLAPGAGSDRRRRDRLEPAGAARFGLLPEPQPLRSADANVDFKVTAAEWDQTASRRFAKLDKDANRRLARDELPETYEQARLARLKPKS